MVLKIVQEKINAKKVFILLKKKNINKIIYYRILFLFCAIITPVITLVWKNNNNELASSELFGWLMSIAFLFSLLFSYISKKFIKHIDISLFFLGLCSTLSALWFSHINAYDFEYSMLFLLTSFGVPLFFWKPKQLLVFYILIIVLFIVSLITIEDIKIRKDTLLAVFLLLSVITCVNAIFKNIEQTQISRLTEEYEKVFNGTQDSMFLIKVLEKGEFRYIRNNVAHQNKTGISIEQISNKTPQELLGKELGDIVAKNYKNCIDSNKSITYEEELNLFAGRRIWLTTLTPVIEADKTPYIVGSSSDITERRKLELELIKYANYDKLTGLPNRRLFFEMLAQNISENERNNSKFALFFIDLDGFKEINDNYGHKIGDEVLKITANRLLKNIQKSNIVSRMGGDEFTVIVKNIDCTKAVDIIVKKIHKALKATITIGDIKCAVNSSIGIALYPDNGKDSETLLKNADSSMYDIKKNGKGGYKLYE